MYFSTVFFFFFYSLLSCVRLSHFIKEPAATREHKLAPNYFHVVLEIVTVIHPVSLLHC